MILLGAIRNIYLINDPSRQPQAQAPGSSPVGLSHLICLLKSRDGRWPFFIPLGRGMGAFWAGSTPGADLENPHPSSRSIRTKHSCSTQQRKTVSTPFVGYPPCNTCARSCLYLQCSLFFPPCHLPEKCYHHHICADTC